MLCKRIVDMIEVAAAEDPDQFAEATKVLASQSSYLRSVLKNKKRQQPGTQDALYRGSLDEGDGASALCGSPRYVYSELLCGQTPCGEEVPCPGEAAGSAEMCGRLCSEELKLYRRATPNIAS